MPEAANYGVISMVPLTITLIIAFGKKMQCLHYLLDVYREYFYWEWIRHLDLQR